MGAHALFCTAPDDLLQFGRGDNFDPAKVAKWMDFDKAAVSIISSVAQSSVRWDEGAPKAVVERLEEVATLANMVATIFDGDAEKTCIWFKTKNPMLGGISPRDMVRMGRQDRLRKFIVNAISDRSEGQRIESKRDQESNAVA